MGKRGRPATHTSCYHCGKAEHLALGLCGACYKYQKRNGKLPDENYRSRSPITKSVAVEMYTLYLSGVPLQYVAARFSFSKSAIRDAFSRFNLRRARPGGATQRKLQPSQVLQVRNLVCLEKMPLVDVARLMNVSGVVIQKIVDGETYKNVGGPVRKPDTVEKRPCTRCTILTTNRSGICMFCEQEGKRG